MLNFYEHRKHPGTFLCFANKHIVDTYEKCLVSDINTFIMYFLGWIMRLLVINVFFLLTILLLISNKNC